MNVSTLTFALGAALSVALADFFLKLSANRISPNLVTLVYALTAVIVPTIWVLWSKQNGEAFTCTREGALLGALVGLSFSFAVVFLTPAIRIVAIVLASALGILILGEDFTWRYALGVVLAGAGIYLIVTR